MFINNAYAAATAADASAMGGTLIQLALILLIFYFFLIRPQQKKMREHATMVEALKVGDKVMLSSGIYGKVNKIKDDKLYLEIATGVEIVVDRMVVGLVVADEKTTKIETKSENKKTQYTKNKKEK